MGRARLSAAAAVLLTLLAPAANAAVRNCQRVATSGPHEAASELAARQAAIAAWVKAATVHGDGYGSWRIAASKSFACTRIADSRFRCEAIAMPCIIEQAPRPNWVPGTPPGPAPKAKPVAPPPAVKGISI
jgi:hypothetical protein